MSILNSSDVQRIFAVADRNGDGRVSVEELSQLLISVGIYTSPDELEPIAGGTGFNLQEFISFSESISSCGDESDIVEAFKVFDLNGDGFISCTELQCVLSSLGMWEEGAGDCARMIMEFDSDLDGLIDLKEFKNMMMNGRQLENGTRERRLDAKFDEHVC